MKIYVTGIGIVSPIGLNAAANLESLSLGRSGILRSEEFNLMMGQVALNNEALLELLHLKDQDYSRTMLLGLLAAKEAWGQNQLSEKIRTGMVGATSIGGLDKMEQRFFNKKLGLNESQSCFQDVGLSTEQIAKQLGIQGIIDTISTACSSGANSIMHGARLLSANKLDRVIVGGADPIAIFNVKGFSSLSIYDSEVCKPFDNDRKGMNLGEGAAYLILENEYSLSQTGNKVLCELVGWNNSSDAFHQSASSAEGLGSTLAMNKAMQKAGLVPHQIDYINAHGTGTGNNDLSESIAFVNVFGEKVPPFSSTKGFTGHTLGAAGAIEAVFSIQALLEQALLPNLNFSTAMEETGLLPVKSYTPNVSINNVMSNSFGFGGNCTSLIFQKA